MSGTSNGRNDQHDSNPTPVTDPTPVEPAGSSMECEVAEQQTQQSVMHANETNEKERARHDEIIDRIKKSERLMIGLTAVIALTGIWGGYVVYWQLKVTEGQLTEMQTGSADTKIIAGAAKTQADNTKKLADATESLAESTRNSVAQGKAALDASIETSRLDQRAWVGVVAARNPIVKPGFPVGLEVKYVNTGKTPAFKFNADIAIRYQPTNEKFIPEFTKPITNPSTLIILPQMDVWSDASKAKVMLTQEQIDSVIAGTAMLYVLGRFTYRTLNTNAGGVFCMYFQRNLSAPPSWCDTYNDVY